MHFCLLSKIGCKWCSQYCLHHYTIVSCPSMYHTNKIAKAVNSKELSVKLQRYIACRLNTETQHSKFIQPLFWTDLHLLMITRNLHDVSVLVGGSRMKIKTGRRGNVSVHYDCTLDIICNVINNKITSWCDIIRNVFHIEVKAPYVSHKKGCLYLKKVALYIVWNTNKN